MKHSLKADWIASSKLNMTIRHRKPCNINFGAHKTVMTCRSQFVKRSADRWRRKTHQKLDFYAILSIIHIVEISLSILKVRIWNWPTGNQMERTWRIVIPNMLHVVRPTSKEHGAHAYTNAIVVPRYKEPKNNCFESPHITWGKTLPKVSSMIPMGIIIGGVPGAGVVIKLFALCLFDLLLLYHIE